MSTTVSLHGQVLTAMRCFTADPKQRLTPAVLTDLLLEITSDSLRLVATDTHVLGILHLTAEHAYGVEISCEEPTRLLLPVQALMPLLHDQRDARIQLTIVGRQITAGNASGLCIPVTGRDTADYPNYRDVIPVHGGTRLAGFAVDPALIARFSAFAKALRAEATLSLRFHAETRAISVYFKNISAFYGLLAPYQDDGPTGLPDWLTPRVIPLQTYDGFSGLDGDGQTWTMVTEEAPPIPRPCVICGQTLSTGWHCLENGDTVCNAHVTLPVTAGGASRSIPGKEVSRIPHRSV